MAPGGSSVLVVEDHADSLQLFGLLLASAGWCVTLAGNAVAALDLARATDFDALLIDVFLPPTNAWEVIHLLQSEGHRPRGMISMSASGRRDVEHRSQAAGCQGHLYKPFSARTLESALQMAIGT